MRAAQIREYGDAGVLSVEENAPAPAVGSGQVLVAVHAASLNPVDSAVRLGYLQQMMPLRFPATLGTDIAGVVKEAGEGVSSFRVGDRVYGMASVLGGASGAFAELASVNAGQIATIPSQLGFVEAAALGLAGVSALQGIFDHIRLRAGQKVLILGGSGGIGTMAIQIAKSIGARVSTTVRAGAAEYARSLGADEVIDTAKETFPAALRGYDAVFDTVGGDTYRSSFPVLKKGGVIVSMLEQPNAELAAKYGVTALVQQTQVPPARLERLGRLAADGTLKVHVDRVFPLDRIRDAFLAREAGGVRGKIVVQIAKG